MNETANKILELKSKRDELEAEMQGSSDQQKLKLMIMDQDLLGQVIADLAVQLAKEATQEPSGLAQQLREMAEYLDKRGYSEFPKTANSAADAIESRDAALKVAEERARELEKDRSNAMVNIDGWMRRALEAESHLAVPPIALDADDPALKGGTDEA